MMSHMVLNLMISYDNSLSNDFKLGLRLNIVLVLQCNLLMYMYVGVLCVHVSRATANQHWKKHINVIVKLHKYVTKLNHVHTVPGQSMCAKSNVMNHNQRVSRLYMWG